MPEQLPPELAAEAAEYLEAARCKVEIAAFHHEQLEQTLGDYPPTRTPLQAHFEGLFSAGVAVFEKLIPGLALAAGLAENARPAEVIAQLKAEPESESIGREVESWTYARNDRGSVIWDEGNDIRNAATHRFYDKQQRPPGHFAYTVAQAYRIRRRRDGMLSEFSQEWIDHVRKLLPIIEAARELWNLPRVKMVAV